MRPSLSQSALNRVVTIESFIVEQERKYAPQAVGDLSNILYDIGLAAKIIKGARIYAAFIGEPRYLASNSAAFTIGGKGVKGFSLSKKG